MAAITKGKITGNQPTPRVETSTPVPSLQMTFERLQSRCNPQAASALVGILILMGQLLSEVSKTQSCSERLSEDKLVNAKAKAKLKGVVS